MISLKQATINECKIVYDWRNHPTIRNFSLNSDEIDFESHKKWFEKIINSKDHYLLIAFFDSTPCGVVRYDCDKSVAKISIYLAPDFIGKGIGSEVLKKGEEWLKLNSNITTIKAEVLPNNKPSLKMFEKDNYKISLMTYEKTIK